MSTETKAMLNDDVKSNLKFCKAQRLLKDRRS